MVPTFLQGYSGLVYHIRTLIYPKTPLRWKEVFVLGFVWCITMGDKWKATPLKYARTFGLILED